MACTDGMAASRFFFFNDTATTEIYTLSLHDALPIFRGRSGAPGRQAGGSDLLDLPPTRLRPDRPRRLPAEPERRVDRKSTRLNSSHANISYAVFCLKKNAEVRVCKAHWTPIVPFGAC